MGHWCLITPVYHEKLIKCILELITQRGKKWNLYPLVLILFCWWAIPAVFTASHHKVACAWTNIISRGYPVPNLFLCLELDAVATDGIRVWDERILKWCIRNVYHTSWHTADMLWPVNINIILLWSINHQTFK